MTRIAHFIVHSLYMVLQNPTTVKYFRAMNAFELPFYVCGQSVTAQFVLATANFPTVFTYVFVVGFVAEMVVVDVLLHF